MIPTGIAYSLRIFPELVLKKGFINFWKSGLWLNIEVNEDGVGVDVEEEVEGKEEELLSPGIDTSLFED